MTPPQTTKIISTVPSSKQIQSKLITITVILSVFLGTTALVNRTTFADGPIFPCPTECTYGCYSESILCIPLDATCAGICPCTCAYGCIPGTSSCSPTPSPGPVIPPTPTGEDPPEVDPIDLGEGFNMGVLVENFFKIAFPLAIILGFIHIVTAGYTLMTSEGDPRKTNEGKERLESAIMGLLFVLLTIGILRIILGTLISGGPPRF